MSVVVPVKSFALAKQRLAGQLDDQQRTALASWCAQRVIEAARPYDVFVACDSDDIEEWARGLGVQTIRCTGPGLNAAADSAVHQRATAGSDLVLVVHGDLPLATSFAHLVRADTVTVVPDHRYDGTNVLVLPGQLAGRFGFQYGRGSFRRHVIEALSLWPRVRVVRDDELAHDLDTPDDLIDPRMEGVRRWLQTSPASPR